MIVQLTLKHIWKKNGFIYEIALSFTRWRLLYQMEAKLASVDTIYRFTQRKTESSGIFVITTEHM